MENELDQDIYIRQFKNSDMSAVLLLVAQIASGEDLTESARQQFSHELVDPKHEGSRWVAALGDRVIGTMGLRRRPHPVKARFMGRLVDR